MARNVIQGEFWASKRPTAAILSKISKQKKIVYRSEMARNEIGSDFPIWPPAAI